MTPAQLKTILDQHKLWIESDGEQGQRATLQHATLRYANLYGANLRGADFRNAILQYANLQHANLQDATLQHADLRGADLQHANLLVIHGPRHTIYALPSHIQIGCERHTLQHWLKNYQEIGKAAGYSDTEIDLYGDMIKMAVKHLAKD